MASLNRMQAIGNVGKDPEIRNMKDGKPVASFSIACTEKWKSKDTGEARESTTWIPVVCFNEGLCRVIEQYVHKGSRLFVEGKWTNRKWQDQEGRDRYSTELVMQGFDSRLIMLDGKGDGERGQSGGNPPAQKSDPNDYDLADCIPF